MADKEERIYIGIIDPKGDSCPVPYGTCNSLCDNCKGGMTRQEAIEVMAKEIYKRRWIESECKNKNTLGFSICKDYAELALNALLGVEK